MIISEGKPRPTWADPTPLGRWDFTPRTVERVAERSGADIETVAAVLAAFAEINNTETALDEEPTGD